MSLKDIADSAMWERPRTANHYRGLIPAFCPTDVSAVQTKNNKQGSLWESRVGLEIPKLGKLNRAHASQATKKLPVCDSDCLELLDQVVRPCNPFASPGALDSK